MKHGLHTIHTAPLTIKANDLLTNMGETSEEWAKFKDWTAKMLRLAEAPKDGCFTVRDLTKRWKESMAHMGIELLGWVSMTFEEETCYVAVVGTTKIMDGFEPDASTLYTKICQGGRCESWNGSTHRICHRNRTAEKPFSSYKGMDVHGPSCCGDDMVSCYDHTNCDKKALRIIGNTGQGCFSMPLYIKEGEPIPELEQKITFDGDATGYYVRAKPEPEPEEDEEASKEEDPQTHEEQPNSKKKRSSDVPNPLKGRLRSGIQKKKKPVRGGRSRRVVEDIR